MRGTVIKRGAKWSVAVDLGADPETGERRRRWHSGYATRREAERARTDILQRIDTAAYIEPSKATVGEYLLREWLPAVRGQVRPGAYDAYQLHCRRYVVPHLGAIPLQKAGASVA